MQRHVVSTCCTCICPQTDSEAANIPLTPIAHISANEIQVAGVWDLHAWGADWIRSRELFQKQRLGIACRNPGPKHETYLWKRKESSNSVPQERRPVKQIGTDHQSYQSELHRSSMLSYSHSSKTKRCYAAEVPRSRACCMKPVTNRCLCWAKVFNSVSCCRSADVLQVRVMYLISSQNM